MRKHSLGWLYVPLVALLLLVLHQPWKQMTIANDLAETQTFAAIPVATFQELSGEHAEMIAKVRGNENPSGDPMTLPWFIAKKNIWDAKTRKYLAIHFRDKEASSLEHFLAGDALMQIQARYQTIFGVEKL